MPLTLKTLIFSGFLYLSIVYSQLFLAAFLAAAFYFYFKPAFNSNQFFYSFLALLVVSLISVSSPILDTQYSILVLGLLFFLLLGVKNLLFTSRRTICYCFHIFLILTILIFFFDSDKFSWFFFKYILLFFAVSALLRDFFAFFLPGPSNKRKENIIALSWAFLAVQFIWLVGFLPFNYWAAAFFVLLVILLLEDFTIHHFSGTITRRIVLRNATAFLILGLAVFAATNWSI